MAVRKVCRRSLTAGALLTIAGACTSPRSGTAPGDPIRTAQDGLAQEQQVDARGRDTFAVQIEGRAYSLADAGNSPLHIPFTYQNRTGRTVYPARCGEHPPNFILEKWVEGRWIRAYEPVCALILIPEPVAVGPGEAHTDTLMLHTAPNFRRSVFQVDDIPGTYRAVLKVYRTWDVHDPSAAKPGELLPEQQTTSHSFQLLP